MDECAKTRNDETIVLCAECRRKIGPGAAGAQCQVCGQMVCGQTVCGQTVCGQTVCPHPGCRSSGKGIDERMKSAIRKARAVLTPAHCSSIFMCAMGAAVILFSIVYGILLLAGGSNSFLPVAGGILTGSLFLCMSKVVAAAELYLERSGGRP